MMRGQSMGVKQWASVLLDAAAGSQNTTVSLPSGQTGRPVKLRAGGAVNAIVTVQFGNSAGVSAMVNPNATPDEIDIPASAFPSPTNTVNIVVNAAAAGYISISVGFA